MKKRTFFILLFVACNNVMISQSFITTWKTDNSGSSSVTSITIPTFSGEIYNYDIDWNNDGVFDEFSVTGNITHDFGVVGTYTIAIRGVFPRIYFNSEGDNSKIISVDQWGSNTWSSMGNAFFGCYNLILNATDVPDLTLVTNMDNMLNGPTQIIEHAPMNNWDTSSVTSMKGTFQNNADFNQDLSNWDTSNVTNMAHMFDNATNFQQDISSWDVSNVINMDSMFRFAGFFNADISGWDVSNVVNMNHMFDNAFAFSNNIGNWDVSIVVSMNFMFRSAVAFNQYIGDWNVGNVADMTSMFFDASSFNQDIANWDTSNLTSTQNMFNNALGFDQNIGNWDVSSVTSMTDMFLNTSLSTENYDSTLIGWNAQTLQNGINFHGGNSTFCNAETARNNMIISNSWTITDGGFDCSGLSINESAIDNFKMYPNPVNDKLFIKGVEIGTQIKILDIATNTISSTLSTNSPLDIGFGFIDEKSATNIPPLASFTVEESSPVAPSVFSFDGSLSKDLDGNIVSYAWTIDGNSFSGPQSSFRFENSGTYDVSLTVVDNDNISRVKNLQVEVGDRTTPPTPIFYSKAETEFGLYKVQFDGSSSFKSGGEIASYRWDFGDGSTGTGVSVTHEYVNPGTYLVSLVVEDNFGLTSSVTKSVSPSDVTPLNITIISPRPGELFNTSNVVIEGALDEDSSLIKINGTRVLQNSDKTFSGTVSLASEGVNIFSIEALDSSGNNQVINLPMIYDSVAPILDTPSPALNAVLYQKDGNIIAGINSNEAMSSIDFDGESVSVLNNAQRTFSKSFVFGGSGVRTISVSGTDLAGNSSLGSISFELNYCKQKPLTHQHQRFS